MPQRPLRGDKPSREQRRHHRNVFPDRGKKWWMPQRPLRGDKPSREQRRHHRNVFFRVVSAEGETSPTKLEGTGRTLAFSRKLEKSCERSSVVEH